VDVLSNLAMGFSIALTPFNLLMATVGVIVGTLIGALPGVGPVSGVALLLPLTFGMDPTSGIIMLAALYAGSMYGGTITSVLINTPGESASVVTCIDGYQMALQGRAGPALGVATIGSFIAGTFGVMMLMLMSPALARWALSFGPPEIFSAIRPVGYQAPCVHKFLIIRDRRQAVLCCEVHDPPALFRVISNKGRLNDESACPLSDHRREGAFDLLGTSYHQRLNLHPESLGGGLRFLYKQPSIRIPSRGKEGHASNAWKNLPKQLQPLPRELRGHEGQTCDVAARAG